MNVHGVEIDQLRHVHGGVCSSLSHQDATALYSLYPHKLTHSLTQTHYLSRLTHGGSVLHDGPTRSSERRVCLDLTDGHSDMGCGASAAVKASYPPAQPISFSSTWRHARIVSQHMWCSILTASLLIALPASLCEHTHTYQLHTKRKRAPYLSLSHTHTHSHTHACQPCALDTHCRECASIVDTYTQSVFAYQSSCVCAAISHFQPCAFCSQWKSYIHHGRCVRPLLQSTMVRSALTRVVQAFSYPCFLNRWPQAQR